MGFFILKYYKILFAVVCLFLSFACKSTQDTNLPSSQSREITDDLNRKVKIPEKVTRAISLAPNLTEIIFAVGAGDKLVGRTDFCNYPEDAKKITSIGDTLKPNVENIIALKPQVVFVSTASQLESFTKTLEAQGITVFVTNPNSLDGIYQSIEKVGEIFGTKDKAAEVVGNLKKRVAAVEEKTKNAAKPKVFVQIDKSLYTIGKDSFITDLINRAGGISATQDLATAYPKLSKETALALNPDIIILSESSDNDEPNEVFKNSNAVKNGKVFKINADILSRPAPRIVAGLEQIAEKIH
ncbi:MAG: cobalamin-binding protein [Pyrinomonadaceae bacterium]|nr:cobalamin-binding protein [Pyrinomonadaceae bacterium]